MNCVSIYSMINEDTKCILIKYSLYDVQKSVYNTKIKAKGIFDEFEYKLIETSNNRNILYLKWRVHELHQEYMQLGYTPYKSYKPIQWKLVIHTELEVPWNSSYQYRAIVKLETSANYVFTVKVFTSMHEAKQFLLDNTVSTAVRLL